MKHPPILIYTKALADETRLRLVRVLLDHELSVGEIVRALGLGQSRISRHFKILAEAGLLASRRDGQWVYYSAAENGTARAYLDAVAPFLAGDEAFLADADAARREVAERARRTEAFFEAHATAWDELRDEALGGLDLGAEIMARMPATAATAADLGCGTGTLLGRLRLGAGRVIGVDSSPKMLEQARAYFARHATNGGVSLRIGDLEHLPLRDGEADFAVMSLALHHLPSPPRGIEEAQRVLTTGGRFVLVDYEQHTDEGMRDSLGDNWLGFSPQRVEKWLRAAGFELTETTRFPLPSGLALWLYGAVKPSQEDING